MPYFLVRKKGATGPVPTLIHAYGGFRTAQTPGYLTGQPYRAGPLGLFWVEEGNAYVLANIRGGGEYGPALARRGVARKAPEQLRRSPCGRRGSDRTGVAAQGQGRAFPAARTAACWSAPRITQRPDLYSAAIIGSPLFDMKRYSHLLAGASWIDEYGDPDKPADWAFLSKYSPYQKCARASVTRRSSSTVRPRTTASIPAMRARSRRGSGRIWQPVYFHEYMEGGHSVGADHGEDAVRAALLMGVPDQGGRDDPALEAGWRRRL